jgi:ribosomal-protein-alanine N-acetyltransferase
MRRRGSRLFVTPKQVSIRPGSLADEDEFLAAVQRSRSLHHPWVQPPATADAYRDYLSKREESRNAAFFIWHDDPHGLAGVVNLNEIVHGSFESAYLGYYAFLPYAGRGLMKEGLSQVITHAFKTLKLHRLEANIQPANRPSKMLVKRLGFHREGLSPRYLKINGRWRDHERWAILSEDW